MENLPPKPPPEAPSDPDMARLDTLAKLLDNQFRVPGTQFRFGLDGIIGLIPFVGDMAGLLVSGVLMKTMLKKGAGPLLMLRMMGNYVLDTLVGVVPFVGDLFDFGFKANRRNVNMLKEYYAKHERPPSAKFSLTLLAILFFILFALLIVGVWKAAAWIWVALRSAF